MKIRIEKGTDYWHLYLNDEQIGCSSFNDIMKRVEALFRIAEEKFPTKLKAGCNEIRVKVGNIEFEMKGGC